MDEAERQKKLEAGRAKNSSDMPRNQSLASFRKKRAKSDGARAAKKTQKGKGQTVSKNDCSTQDRWVEPPLSPASATGLEGRTGSEGGSNSEKSENQQNDQREDQCSSPERSLSPVEDLIEEELAALTGKEQLKLLQQAVEKRNEIISKLSHNLQEALASRDQVQLEAQSLAGQIQALQKQLQQTSVEFLRIKGHSGAEAFGVVEHHHGLSSQATNIKHNEATPEGSGNASHGSQQSPEGFSTDSDTETDTVLHKLMFELEEERKKNQCISAELAKEMERNLHVLSLLEEVKQGREEERKEREAQLQDLQTQLQTQCLTMQQYKEEKEKEKLNREVLELRKVLQEKEDSERTSNLGTAGSVFSPQTHEEENKRLEDEMKRLKEEVEHVMQLLDKSERQLKQREKEVEGLKAFKNQENHAKAVFTAEGINTEEANLESGPDDNGNLDTSGQGDILMARYLTSFPAAYSQSSVVNESFKQPSQLDVSADCSFELNSEVFGDQPLLSISNRVCEENENIENISSSQYGDPPAGDPGDSLASLWPHSSASGEMGLSQLSEQQFEDIDLEKQLLSQQCGELREELVLKERDLGVLREEVIKTAEELEEARSRWAQVTEELQEVLSELEEERERRRLVEEEMNLKAHEQDSSTIKALMDEMGNETVGTLMGLEAGRTAEISLFNFAISSSEYVGEPSGKLNEETEEKILLLAPQNQEEPQMEMKASTDSTKDISKPSQEIQIQTLQAYCDHLKSELEETKMEQKTASTLLSLKVAELDALSKELEMTREQFQELQAEVDRLQQEILKRQDSLHCAERQKHELESQIHSLRENLACMEEAQALFVKQREEEKRKEQQMDEQIKKMEQVLEEELEQFENMMKAKDAELAEEKEKWEEERQEKEKLIDVTRLLEEKMNEEVKTLLEKQALAVEEASGRLEASHEQEIKDLMAKHQQEISELNDHLETELLKQQVSMEEEQKRQITFIKEVTEREHERMVSELTAKHNEELEQLRTEVSLELRESMEAAHQAEMHQAQAQKTLELEALRLSLTTLHMSQLETSQANVQQEQHSALCKLQASMRDTFTQESALLQARHQSDLDRINQQNQEQQDRLQKLHQKEIDELKQHWESRSAQERASMDEKQDKEIQALRVQWETEAETISQRSLSEIHNRLNAAQTELINTQASLAETSNALADARAALPQTQSELQETKATLEELQMTSKEQVQKLEEDLKQACADKDAAANSLEELVCSHKTALQQKEQQILHLEEKERQLQQEVLHLQEEKALLKKSSEEEVGLLWTQVESMRASRQELGELKEQLMARSSQVDDIEHLKTEFSEQKREIKVLHETELENLRKYFEKRLHASEETYKEEIALLQLRLVESALEESVMKTAEDCTLHHIPAEEKDVRDAPIGRTELLDELRLELEAKHAMDLSKLESSLALSYKEELEQVRSDLTHHYYEELQGMKTRHALESEQLRAKLSESHLQDLTTVHLEAERQVEVEVEQRMWRLTEELQTRTTIIHTLENSLAALSKRQKPDHGEDILEKQREELQQKHENEISALRSDLKREKKCLEEALEKRAQMKSLEVALNDDEEGPQLLMVKQRLEAQYDNELQKAKNNMAVEIKELKVRLQEQSEEMLGLAQQRFREEKAALEQHLVQRHEKSMAELEDKHKAELEQRTTLQNKHSEDMNALSAKHKAQLDSLSACHRDMVIEHENKHKAELVALESALHSKQMEDLRKLEAAFQETSQAQLEALEAELARTHQEERDELEKRMLGNMDTLEATYLKEVQALRDEINQLEEKYRQDLISTSSEHKQLMELQAAEQLKRELAQVHMEKFKAMAAELSHVHKIELAAQKETLDTEHCKALEALKQQVLELEQQHSTALQELSQSFSFEKEQLVEQHQTQLLELRGTSARELDACRRELEEESARQREHFLEEVELLKVQSEERLQDKINQLKTEFEERKEVELEDLRQSFTSKHQEKEESYTSKMSQLTTQLQQLDAVVTQLRAEIGCLQVELHGKRSEMETLDTLLQRRERESQEGANLLKMLTDDLQDAKEQRSKLHNANEKMSKVLIEMLRSVIATEELIGQKISTRIQTNEQKVQRSSTGNKDQESGISVADLTSEDMELTQMLCESLLVTDTQINPGGEESALKACSRLRLAVETLLDLLNQAHTQLEQTCSVHFTLEEKFSQGREDTTHLLEQHRLLMKQLDEEAKLKSRLQLELHKAEGLLEGYVAEKAALEESLQQKETREEKLVEELEDLKVKLHKMQGLTAEVDSVRVKYQELTEEHAILLRQKEHLSAGLGEREKALLAETERLTQDRLDLQRQAEKDHKSLSLRLRNLERELEDQETKGLEKELQHKNHTEDLSQRVQALEKQLKHDRQFIEEQAVEREHERDEFQQEIRRLEAQLRQTVNVDNKAHKFEDLLLQVESLQAIIKDKTEDYSSLLEANQQVQCDLAERNEEIDKLAGRIRELEQALLNGAESVRTVSDLEQELHKAKQREQELTQDKLALEQQQLSSRLQISALQSKLDETRHCYHDNTRDPTQELRDALDAAQQNLHRKEQEVEVLLSQLENVQSDLNQKEVELKHLTAQLELLTNKNVVQVQELKKEISSLKDTVSTLTDLNEKKEQIQMAENEEETLPAALLQEKNQEIDHLNCEIQKLEQELESARSNKVSALKVELEDLQSRVEHLQSEITRVRQEKQEEEERLHEVISTLQAELATLGPNLHEVSDSQDGDSINPSPSPSPEPHMEHLQERRGGPNSLKHEISLTHSAASSSLRSRLKALQSQFETAVAEKEGLERLLLSQEEEYRTQGEEFGKRIRAEREKLDEIQGLLRLRDTELEEEKEKRKLSKEESDRLKVKAEEANTIREEKDHLNSVVLYLQKSEQERMREIEALKTKDHEMKLEMEVLREASLTLEKQVQEVRAENVEMAKGVAEGRGRIKTLETVKGELSAEREALRGRECQLQEEIEKLRKEVGSMKVLIQELTVKLREKEISQEESQKEVLTHADVTLAKADIALRQRESEFAKLKAESETLKTELAAAKQGLRDSSERAGALHENRQIKDGDLVDLEAENQRMRAELERLQEDVVVQEEELAYQRRELEQLRLRCQQQDIVPHHQNYQIKDISHRTFEEVLIVSRDEASLSSPEVLRRLECSEDRIREHIHGSVLDSRLSELSGLNGIGLDPTQEKTSPRVVMEPPHSRTITPDPATQSTHSPGSLSVSDRFSVLDSLDPDKLVELEELDLTAPPSPLGSTSSFSAQEWNSDGYGSNVSSELGARLKVELEQTERLDAQFVQYLRCRGINPTANTDSAAGSMSYSDDLLSPELQGLLRKVYQESCRILTLSQRRSAPSSQPNTSELKTSSSRTQHHFEEGSTLLDHRDNSASSNPPMSWQQEKRALQETVVALRELLCRMAQRQTQTDYSDDGWHRSQLQSDGHVEAQLKAELEENQRQLKCAHDALQEHKNKMLSLRLAVEEAEEALRTEQKRFQELQQELEQERALVLRKDREEEERREAVQVSSEKFKCEVMSLKGQVEQERVACSNLRRELQIEQSRSVLLEKRLEDEQKELEGERKRFTLQQELLLQEQSRVERLLIEAESHLTESRSKLADSHRKLDEERQHCSRQMDELSRRHEADSARDQKFISDLRSQLEQERRQGEDLAAVTDKLRAELLQSRRKWEEEDRIRLEELQKEKEAATRHTFAAEALKEQKRELSSTLEMERRRTRQQDVELTQLKEMLQLLKEKERKRDDQLEKQRRKERQELMESEMRRERTNSKLLELELLRQKDQQRMQELQQTLTDLEREERQMAAQRLSGKTPGLLHHKAMSPQRPHSSSQTDGAHAGASQQHLQRASTSSSDLLESLVKENSELTQRVTTLSQERATYKGRLANLEKQLRRTECELAKVTTETENQPISDSVNSRLQRYYERYLRAESFRKALVYQKRYLLLLLGGFQDCEEATLCLIARMGVRPSPPLITHRRPLWRFRAVVRVVIAVSRMRFLTRKWQRAIKRVPLSGTTNGHASGPKADVLRQQQPKINSDSAQNRDGSGARRDAVSSLAPPGKSFRLQRRPQSTASVASGHSAGTSQDPERSLTEYIHHLEKVQQRLVGPRLEGLSAFQCDPK